MFNLTFVLVKNHLKIVLLILFFLLPTANFNAKTVEFKPWLEYPEYLFFVIPNTFGKLDPIYSSPAQTKFALSMVFEHLVRINTEQSLEPELAKSWEFQNDNTSIVIDINEGHFFSDGEPVTANDVAQSLIRFCGSDSKATHELSGLVGCHNVTGESGQLLFDSIKILGPYTLELDIDVSPTIILYQLAAARAVIVKEVDDKLIGSGPYKIRENSEKIVIFDENFYYHSKEFVKNAGVIVYHVERDDLEIFLENEKPDGTLMNLITNVSEIDNNNYYIENNPLFITHTLVLNNQRFPFNNKIVRQAIAAAIYNESEIEKCFPNVHKAYGVIPIGLGGSSANMAPEKVLEIQPEVVFQQVPELRNLLVETLIHVHSEHKNSCEEEKLVEAAKKYNIDVKFQYHVDYSTLLPLYLDKNLDGLVDSFNFTNREAYSVFQFFIPSSQENFANIKDEWLDELFKNALVETSSRRRFQAYREMNNYILDESMVIPYYYVGTSNLVSKCLAGIPERFWFNPFWYIPENYRQEGCQME